MSGFVHFDLKPANVFMDLSSSRFTAVVADMGIAKIIGSFVQSEKVSIPAGLNVPIQNGMTIAYAAPECLLNSFASSFCLEANKKSDVYSYAITIFELINPQKAWHQFHMADLVSKIIKGERPIFAKDCTESLKNTDLEPFPALLEKCWSQDPKERPSFQQIIKIIKKESN